MTGFSTAPIIQAAAFGEAFAQWWIGELRALLPKEFNRAKARIEAHPCEHGIEIRVSRGDQRSLGWIESGNASADVRSQLRREQTQLPVWLVPPGETILSKIVQIPRSAASHFKNLLPIEISRWTPFSLNQVVVAWKRLPDPQESKAAFELRLVSRASIATWLETLGEHGLSPTMVALGDLSASIHHAGKASKERRVTSAAILAACLSILSFVATDWLAARRERDFWHVQVEDGRRELARQGALQAKIDEIVDTAREARANDGQSRSILLAAVSRALPEGDWLTDLTFRGTTISLRGYATQPELLVKAIEPLAVERAVAMQGDAAFDAKANRNRFNLVFQAGR